MMRETMTRQRGTPREEKRKIEEKQREKEKKMTIERCDKCGKAFMSRSEVERHKIYEHPVPVSPFEERRFASGTRENNSNNDITTIGSGQIRKVPFRMFRA